MSKAMHRGGLAGQWGKTLVPLVAGFCLAMAIARAQTPTNGVAARNDRELTTTALTRDNNPAADIDPTNTLSVRQRDSIMQANFRKSKSDATELATLAKDLCGELSKANVDVRSAEVASRLEKIEKLAKKIREETKGF